MSGSIRKVLVYGVNGVQGRGIAEQLVREGFEVRGVVRKGDHAAELRRANVNVNTMMSLEMLGYYSDRPKSQRYPPGLSLLYPDRGCGCDL